MLTVAFLLAQLQPIQKIGTNCPMNYYISGNYCVPRAKSAYESTLKTSSYCPPGTYISGNYCTWRPSYQ
jgi:hypothetical protein